MAVKFKILSNGLKKKNTDTLISKCINLVDQIFDQQCIEMFLIRYTQNQKTLEETLNILEGLAKSNSNKQQVFNMLTDKQDFKIQSYIIPGYQSMPVFPGLLRHENLNLRYKSLAILKDLAEGNDDNLKQEIFNFIKDKTAIFKQLFAGNDDEREDALDLLENLAHFSENILLKQAIFNLINTEEANGFQSLLGSQNERIRLSTICILEYLVTNNNPDNNNTEIQSNIINLIKKSNILMKGNQDAKQEILGMLAKVAIYFDGEQQKEVLKLLQENNEFLLGVEDTDLQNLTLLIIECLAANSDESLQRAIFEFLTVDNQDKLKDLLQADESNEILKNILQNLLNSTELINPESPLKTSISDFIQKKFS